MAIICTGLSPLLNLCCSGLVPESSTIQFLDYRNSHGDHSLLCTNRIGFARDIADCFGYDLVVHGPFEWLTQPKYNVKKVSRIHFEKPHGIEVDSTNLVTENLSFCIDSIMGGSSVDFFPEGASCFQAFRAINQLRVFRKSGLIRAYTKHFLKSHKTKPYKRHLTWILPDRDGYVEKFIGSTKGYRLLNASMLDSGYRRFQKYLLSKYSEINLPETNSFVFHPISPELSGGVYSEWIKTARLAQRFSGIFIKEAPRSIQSCFPALSGCQTYRLPEKFKILPSEVFTIDSDMTYFGYFSTSLLSFKRESMLISPPNDRDYTRSKSRTFAGMSNILDL